MDLGEGALMNGLARALVTLIAALLVFASTAGAAATYPALPGKWDVGSFDLSGAFGWSKAAPLDGGGVTFPFLNRPDTSYLVTDNAAYRGLLLGDLTGVTIEARIDVAASPEAVFEYWGEPDGSGRAANVRFYFETDTSLGPVVCPCAEKGVSSFWWSKPASVDLEALKAGDTTLSVSIDPAQWVDGQNQPGNSDAAHLGYFALAAAAVDHIGLSFGGGRSFHNGVGIRDGSGSGTFRLVTFKTAP
jgi:hypothetical protein